MIEERSETQIGLIFKAQQKLSVLTYFVFVFRFGQSKCIRAVTFSSGWT